MRATSSRSSTSLTCTSRLGTEEQQETFPVGRLDVHGLLQHRLGRGGDSGDRSAQLVRRVSDEPAHLFLGRQRAPFSAFECVEHLVESRCGAAQFRVLVGRLETLAPPAACDGPRDRRHGVQRRQRNARNEGHQEGDRRKCRHGDDQ